MNRYSGLLNSMPNIIKTYHFWLVVVMFAIGMVLHYPQQTLSADSPSLFSFLGLTRYTVERVFFLLPVAYASFFLGIRAGLVSLAIALAIMLPRVFLISLHLPDALLETGAVTVIGGIIILQLRVQREDIIRLKSEDRVKLTCPEINQTSNTAVEDMCVIDKDSDVLRINEAFSTLYSKNIDEVKGKKCYELVSDPLCRNGDCSPAQITNGEERVEREEGKKHPVYTTIPCIAAITPFRLPNGELVSVAEGFKNITESKQAHESWHGCLGIVRAREEERKRIARELHDDTAQNLIVVLHQLGNFLNDQKELPATEAVVLRDLYNRIRDILQELRRFSRDLRPSILDDLGLLPAVEWLTDKLKTEYGIDASLKITGNKQRLSQEAELLFFRIIQEALRNTAKHAQASEAEVKIEFGEDKIRITINDNGLGFSPPKKLSALPQTGKLGLAGLQERVHLLGGSFKLESELGIGTKIFVEVLI